MPACSQHPLEKLFGTTWYPNKRVTKMGTVQLFGAPLTVEMQKIACCTIPNWTTQWKCGFCVPNACHFVQNLCHYCITLCVNANLYNKVLVWLTDLKSTICKCCPCLQSRAIHYSSHLPESFKCHRVGCLECDIWLLFSCIPSLQGFFFFR